MPLVSLGVQFGVQFRGKRLSPSGEMADAKDLKFLERHPASLSRRFCRGF